MADTDPRRPTRSLAWCALLLLLAWPLVIGTSTGTSVQAQDTGEAADTAGPTAPGSDQESTATGGDGEIARKETEGIDLFELIVKGGSFMIPIGLMSLLVVTFIIERSLGMRNERVIPPLLVDDLGALADDDKTFDPRQAYRICQRNPSPAASVIRAMLLKVGRPQSEVEHAVAEASEREADRLYSNVRWLNLAAAVTPLMGLLGTVWGMIRAFHDTTQLQAGRNKADFLAEGIYVALVTTLGGLLVAIPAAISSHYFEGRVQRMFHEIDEMLFNLMPQVERYEGKVRFSQASIGNEEAADEPVDDGADAAAEETESSPSTAS